MTHFESAHSDSRLVLAAPDGQRYSCQRCGWCCKWWRIEVTQAERERLLAHDWGAENPRLRGVKLFEEVSYPNRREPLIHTAQVGGRCVFLDDDEGCIIHTVLGLEAKPAGCRRFPLRVGLSPEGVLVGADYSCRAIVSNRGRPFAEAARQLRDADLDPAVWGAGSGARAEEPIVLIAPGVQLQWGGYLDLERAILEVMEMVGYPVSARFAAVRELISAVGAAIAVGGANPGEGAKEWLLAEREDGYSQAFLAAAFSMARLEVPVSMLAPLIGDVETSHSSTTGRGSGSIGSAMAIVAGSGAFRLSTLDAWIDLGSAARVECDLDMEPFDDYLSRFLSAYVLRKSLLESASLRAGWEYLGTCLGLVQWYARASAFLAGRVTAGVEDLMTGIQVVEKAYVS